MSESTAEASGLTAIDWSMPPQGLDTIAADLRTLREIAGRPSYAEISRRVAQRRGARGVPYAERRMPRSTLYDAFQDGRRRLDTDAVTEIALALGLPEQQLGEWAERLRQARAASDGAAIVHVRPAPPPPVDHFAGRQRELDLIDRALSGPTPRVWISGMAGAGKTQLSLSGAKGRDAIFINVRGDQADGPTVHVDACQRAILHQFGSSIPTDASVPERARRLREVHGDCLLVIDDAPDLAFIDALLGDEPSGPILVTSRVTPPTDDGSWSLLKLGGLDARETAEVLRAMAPPSGNEVDPAAAARLAHLSDGLPLTIALVGSRLLTHPTWTVSEHVSLLEDQLTQAKLDDALKASLSVAVDTVEPSAAALLRAMAVLPVDDLDVPSLSALTDRPEEEVARLLTQLERHNLVISRPEARFGQHSAVRAFARALAEETDPPTARKEAFGRLALHLARMSWTAYAAHARGIGDSPRPTTFPYPDSDWSLEEATGWLATNRPAILAIAHSAPGQGFPEYLLRISEALSFWMAYAGHPGEALLLHEAAAATAQQIGDQDGLAMASLDAGQLLLFGGQPEEALTYFDRASLLSDDGKNLSDPGLRGVLWNMASLVLVRQGRLTEAIETLRKAVALHERLDQPPRLSSALVNMSVALHRRGDFAEEEKVLKRAIDLTARSGNEFLGIFAAVNLLGVHDAMGVEPPDLLVEARATLERCEAMGVPQLALTCHANIAEALSRLGRHEESVASAERAVAMARDLGVPLLLSETLYQLARSASGAGADEAALAALDEAESVLLDDPDGSILSRTLLLRGRILPERRDDLWAEALRVAEAAEDVVAEEIRAAIASH